MEAAKVFNLYVEHQGRRQVFDGAYDRVSATIHTDFSVETGLSALTFEIGGLTGAKDFVTCDVKSLNTSDETREEPRVAWALQTIKQDNGSDLGRLLCGRLPLVRGKVYNLPMVQGEEWTPAKGLSFCFQVMSNEQDKQSKKQSKKHSKKRHFEEEAEEKEEEEPEPKKSRADPGQACLGYLEDLLQQLDTALKKKVGSISEQDVLQAMAVHVYTKLVKPCDLPCDDELRSNMHRLLNITV